MSNENEKVTETLEVVDTSTLDSITRSEIDSQISTAKKYPRTLSTVKQSMLSFATLDVETASGCFYTLPGRKGGDGKPIQGPSVRMAEIALSCYQNLRAGARVISDDGKQITAQGVCHDLQNNVCVSVEVKRRVTTKDGRRYSDDMVVMTGNAACSIALRNSVFRVVPLALVKPVYEAAKRTAIGDAKTLVQRRADAMALFSKMGVDKERILHTLDVRAVEDITLEHLETMIGYYTAIKDGDSSVDEAFPAVGAAEAANDDRPLSERIKSKKTDPKATEQKQETTATKAKDEPAKEPTPKAESIEEKKEEAAPTVNREELIARMQDAMLDHRVTESKLFDYAKKVPGLVHEGAASVWEIATDSLVKLEKAIPALGTKKG